MIPLIFLAPPPYTKLHKNEHVSLHTIWKIKKITFDAIRLRYLKVYLVIFELYDPAVTIWLRQFWSKYFGKSLIWRSLAMLLHCWTHLTTIVLAGYHMTPHPLIQGWVCIANLIFFGHWGVWEYAGESSVKARHIFQSKKTKNSFVNGGRGVQFFFVDLFLPNILSKIVAMTNFL